MKQKKESGALEVFQVEAFIRGDMEGFRQVYARYRQRVLTYCLYFMGNRVLAEDAFQEVFTRIYTHRAQLRNPNALTTWIIMVTRTVCLNMLRTSKFKPEFISIDEQDLNIYTPNELSVKPADDQTLDDELLSALSQLPVIYRDAFLLCEFEGHSYEEVATLTNTNVHNVQVRVTRAKKMLRETLAPKGDNAEVIPRKKPRKQKFGQVQSSLEYSIVDDRLSDGGILDRWRKA